MLKLTYSRKSDRFRTVTVIGDAEGIRDLFWQLTHNYTPKDGTAIGEITVTNLDGADCTKTLMTTPHTMASRLSNVNASH